MKWMRKLIIAIVLANVVGGSALSAQIQPGKQAATGDYQKAYTDAYGKSFRAAFRTKSVEQCVSSAPKAAAAGYDLTPTCTCAADTLLATYTVEQLEGLAADALGPVTSQCLKTNPPLRTPKR